MLLGGAVVLLAIAVVIGGIVWLRSNDGASPRDTTASGQTASTASSGRTVVTTSGGSSSTTSAPGPSSTWTSQASAFAPVTSPDSVDGAGNPTSYTAANMLDGDPTTAWRMDGDGSGQTLQFDLGAAVPISRLGLVNGYAKVDPTSGVDRYTQGRRITTVTWSVGGQTFTMNLADGNRRMQAITFPPVTASRVYLTIDAVTAPGEPAFNYTAISDIRIAND